MLFLLVRKSSFLDFSEIFSDDIRSLFYLNKNYQENQDIAKYLGLLPMMFAVPEQVHSSNVICIDKPGTYNNTDGLITNNPNVLLTLKVADCVPIYLYANKSKIIGLVHAGWRGTIGGIISNSIEKMIQLGADKKEINIFLGPSIGFCCYKVDNDVADYFNSNAKIKLKDGKWKIGMREQINSMLIKLDISPKNIKISNLCTFETVDYHSYRRDGINSGRMVALMSLQT